MIIQKYNISEPPVSYLSSMVDGGEWDCELSQEVEQSEWAYAQLVCDELVYQWKGWTRQNQLSRS